MFIAATIPVEKAGEMSPAMEAAMAIGEPPSKDDKPKAQEPAPGSYEKFLAAFARAV